MGILLIPKRASIGRVMLDATIREQHTFSNTKTSRPIESGARMSDHVQTALPRVTVDGIVSLATPSPSATLLFAGLFSVQSRTYTGLTHAEIVPALIKIHNDREPVDVWTSLGLYRDMVMLSLVFPRDADTRTSTLFTAEFERSGRVNLLGQVDVSGPDGGLLSSFADLGDLGLVP